MGKFSSRASVFYIDEDFYFSYEPNWNWNWNGRANGGGRKKQRRQGNSSVRRHIPEELVEKILVRLPVKSLIRFKSVSKSWRSLIESRCFIDLHRGHHSCDHSDQLLSTWYERTSRKEAAVIVMKNINLAPASVDLRWLPPMATVGNGRWRPKVRALGPLSNGIYCLVTSYHNSGHRVAIASGEIALCNPATHDYKPTSPLPRDSYPLLCYIAQKPCRVHYGFGTVFGHGDCLDYRVVIIVSWGPWFSSFMSFMYSSRVGKWRKIADYEHGKRDRSERQATDGLVVRGDVNYPEIARDLELCPQRLHKGSWHWMAVHRDYTCSLLSFNFADQAFKLIRAPSGYRVCGSLGTTHNHVKGCGVLLLKDHLAAIFFTCRSTYIDIWMMTEYGVEESWTKIYAIEPNFYDPFRILVGISFRLDRGGYGIDRIFFADYENQLVSCHESGYTKHGVYPILGAIWWNTLGLSTYIETLESLP